MILMKDNRNKMEKMKKSNKLQTHKVIQVITF